MPRVTFSAIEAVWIKVKGEPRHAVRGQPPAVLCPDDGGLILRLWKYLDEEKICPVAGINYYTGGGELGIPLAPAHAEKVLKWLEVNGAERQAFG